MSSVLVKLPSGEIMPFHEIADKELICELPKTSTVLYGIFIELIRQFYISGNNNNFLAGVPDISWDPDVAKSGIWIDSELRWEDENPEFRPSIIVGIQGMQYETSTGGRSPFVSVSYSGNYTFSRVGSGTVTFTHVGSTAGEACALCDNTAEYLKRFSTAIRDDFCFLNFAEASRKPISQFKPDSHGMYASVTTFSFKFEDAWSLQLESPIIKEISVKSLKDPEYSGSIVSDSVNPVL